ncbi:hypothetical protein RUND412_007261 [Rhizina undulata]
MKGTMSEGGGLLITISGGQAAGKKMVQEALKSKLVELFESSDGSSKGLGPGKANRGLSVLTIKMGDFLRSVMEEELKEVEAGKIDLERIEAFDLDLMAETIERLKSGDRNVIVPSVDFKGKKRKDVIITEVPDVIIAEGCYILCHKKLVDLATVKIFVDCDPDVRLARKVVRDNEERFLPIDFILDQYIRHSKPAYEQTILPTKHISDIILPGGSEGPGIDLIAQGVMDDLKAKMAVGGSRRSAHGGAVTAVMSGLPITLSEADLGTGGGPSYYETV